MSKERFHLLGGGVRALAAAAAAATAAEEAPGGHGDVSRVGGRLLGRLAAGDISLRSRLPLALRSAPVARAVASSRWWACMPGTKGGFTS